MDQKLFDIWFNNHFLRYAPSSRPILLLLDGHSSHYCPDTVRLAAWEKVILFALPPNTTHLSQPLDKGCFGPLKVAWQHVCHQYLAENPGKVITRYQFSALLNKAWMHSMTIANVCTGFRVTGIYPVNREVFSYLDESPLTRESGLAFIPLYSPASKRTTSQENNELDFSEDEVALFERRYGNKHDIPINMSRYNLWLTQKHPDAPECQCVYLQFPKASSISIFCSTPHQYRNQLFSPSLVAES